MDDLLPMYIVGCRSLGVDPKVNKVLNKLMDAKHKPNSIAYLLRRHD